MPAQAGIQISLGQSKICLDARLRGHDTVLPYWRLAACYFFHFAPLGIIVPFWNLYLHNAGLDAKSIGMVLATFGLTRLLFPALWSWLIDHTGRGLAVMRITAFASAICFAGFFFANQFTMLFWIMFGFGLFYHAVLPQLESTTLNHLGERSSAYGRVRLWGSIGFIVTAVLVGSALEYLDTTTLPYWIVSSLILLFVSLTLLPNAKPVIKHNGVSFISALKQPTVLVLILACILMYISFGPFNNFLAIYLTEHGHTYSFIGFLWAFGVLCEIILFIYMPRVFHVCSAKIVLIISFAGAALRWVLMGLFPEILSVLLFAQALHALSYAAFHAAAISLIHRHFVAGHQSRGQALYGSVSYGVGGTLGSLYSGYAWEQVGGSNTFFIAAVFAVLGMTLVALFLHKKTRQEDIAERL